jgi:hypothetical protein
VDLGSLMMCGTPRGGGTSSPLTSKWVGAFRSGVARGSVLSVLHGRISSPAGQATLEVAPKPPGSRSPVLPPTTCTHPSGGSWRRGRGGSAGLRDDAESTQAPEQVIEVALARVREAAAVRGAGGGAASDLGFTQMGKRWGDGRKRARVPLTAPPPPSWRPAGPPVATQATVRPVWGQWRGCGGCGFRPSRPLGNTTTIFQLPSSLIWKSLKDVDVLTLKRGLQFALVPSHSFQISFEKNNFN